MPFLSGFEAALAMRKSEVRRIREIKIIALTASVQIGDREKCLAAGMNSYLSKVSLLSSFATSDELICECDSR